MHRFGLDGAVTARSPDVHRMRVVLLTALVAFAAPAGTAWAEVPDDWACPDCGVRDKVDFEPVEDGA